MSFLHEARVYVDSHAPLFCTQSDVEIDATDEDNITIATFIHKSVEIPGSAIELNMTVDSWNRLAYLFNLHRFDDLQDINYLQLWQQYLLGNASVVCNTRDHQFFFTIRLDDSNNWRLEMEDYDNDTVITRLPVNYFSNVTDMLAFSHRRLMFSMEE